MVHDMAPVTERTDLKRSVWYSGYLLTFLVTGEESEGRYSLVEEVGRRGTSANPPLHFQTREEESFYVIEGEVNFFVGDELIRARPGTFVRLLPHVPHRFEIVSNDVRMLNLCVPAGFEGFFHELSEPARSLMVPPAPEGPPDIDRLLATARKYGVEMVGPPPRS